MADVSAEIQTQLNNLRTARLEESLRQNLLNVNRTRCHRYIYSSGW